MHTGVRGAVWVLMGGSMMLAGCGLRSEPFGIPTPAQQEELADRVGADPTDVEAVAGLAAALFAEARYEEARRVLLATDSMVPDDPTVTVMLGLTEHALRHFGAARDRYVEYLARNPGAFADRVRARLDAIEPEVVRVDARALLDAPSRSGRSGLDSTRVLVIPLPLGDGDERDAALSTGLADLLGRDLTSNGFQVVDRAMVEALLDGVGVDRAAPADLSLTRRLALLTGAGRAVIGATFRTEDARELVWEALAVTFHSDGGIRLVPVRASGPSARVLDLEKAIAIRLNDAFGVRLWPAEAILVARRQTVRLEALSAFGAGLRALAASEHEQAVAYFDEAAALDPGFELARESSTRVSLVVETSNVPMTVTVEHSGREGERRRVVSGVVAWTGSLRYREFRALGAGARSVVAEVMGRDHVGLDLMLELMFELPWRDGR
ncbi:MAG: hypothetical protein OEZ65_15725 [Gemmatimonadota bacterium]|nr:hypothetical protein [Gemmatimonadota bacterium]